tara:strand:+ start:146 stop:568 length:423 start_codon:yes stop_codon:yes gene_type:complete
MSWKDILKRHCGGNREKMNTDNEKELEKLTGGQKELDKDKDGKITGKDFAMLRNEKVSKRELRDGDITISHDECKDMEKKILAEVKKEGGALGMKNLKGIGSPKKLKMVLKDMMERGTIKQHEHGDFYTDNPSRGRGFTA